MKSLPDDYTIRAAAIDDLRGVLHVQRAARTHDIGLTSFSEADLRGSWDESRLSLIEDTWVALDGEGTIVAYAEIPRSQDNESWCAVYVLPDYRGRGIEDALLPLIKERLHARNLQPKDGPVILYGRAFEANQALQEVFESEGYERNLTFQIMQVDLTEEQPAPEWPTNIEVRTFRLGEDEQAAYEADEEAGQDKGYHTPLTFDAWAQRMGLNKPEFDHSLWFLAWSGGELAAVCLNYIDAATGTAWIDHLGVRRAWRKQGLGMALLRHSFREFQARGITTAKLSVDSGSLTNAPRLYTQAGMAVVQKYHIYRKDLR